MIPIYRRLKYMSQTEEAPEQGLNLIVHDANTRLWLYHQLKLQLEQYGVSLIYTDKGFTLKGSENKIQEGLKMIKSLQNSHIVKGLVSEGELEKLDAAKGKFNNFEVESLREKYPDECNDLRPELEYLIVFKKEHEMEIANILGETVGDVIEVSVETAFVMVYIKQAKKCLQKFGCDVKIKDSDKNLLMILKGSESAVEAAKKHIELVKRSYMFKVIISDKKIQSNRLMITPFKDRLKEKEYHVIYNQKMKNICERIESNLLQKYFLETVETHRNFLGVIIQCNEEAKIDEMWRNFYKLHTELEENSRYGTGSYNRRREPEITRVEETYCRPNIPQKIKKTQMEEQRQEQFLIDKWIYQGIRKFSNFEKKLLIMQQDFGIELFPEELKRQDGSSFYVISFMGTKSSSSIKSELEFFFNEYRPKFFTAFVSGIVNISKLKKYLANITAKQEDFKDVIVDDVDIKSGFLQLRIYSGKLEIKKTVQDLEKFISKEIGSAIKLIEKNQK